MELTMIRKVDPAELYQVYSCIMHLRDKAKPCTMENLTSTMSEWFSKERSEELIEDCVRDQSVVKCLDEASADTNYQYFIAEGLRITEQRMKFRHDWYCFACNRAGPLIFCSNCSKSYHKDCASSELKAQQSKAFTCISCRSIRQNYYTREIQEKFSKSFVKFTYRLRDKFVKLTTTPPTEVCPFWRNLVYEDYNIETLHKECLTAKVKTKWQFMDRIHLIMHNVAVGFGKTHKMYEQVLDMYKSLEEDFLDLDSCVHCYYTSWICSDGTGLTKRCVYNHRVEWVLSGINNYLPVRILRQLPLENKFRVMKFDQKGRRFSVFSRCLMSSCPVEQVRNQLKTNKTSHEDVARMLEYVTDGDPTEVCEDDVSVLKSLLKTCKEDLSV